MVETIQTVKPETVKLTEFGLLPEDWQLIPLIEYAEIRDGTHDSPKYQSTGVPLVTSKNIINGKIDLVDVSYISLEDAQLINKRSGVTEGDILMSMIGTIGNVALVLDEPSFCIKNVALFKPFNKSIDSNYVFCLLNSNLFLGYLLGKLDGGIQKFISLGTFRGLVIPVPPTKTEQRAIAQALSDADALVGALERLIAKKRLIKQGAMQELLSPKFSWVARALDEVADVIDPHPSHRAPAEYANGVPYLGIGDLSESGEIIGTKLRKVHPSVLDEHAARYNTNDNLIGLGRVASIGKVVRIKPQSEPYLISPTLGIIKARFADSDYIYHYLLSRNVSDQFAKIMSGSTRSSVGMIVLRKLEIKLPPSHEEQTRVATILSDMDAEISALEAKLAKARQIKQGMMQQLLTGKIRLL